jgi:hypothetical protein
MPLFHLQNNELKFHLNLIQDNNLLNHFLFLEEEKVALEYYFDNFLKLLEIQLFLQENEIL